MNSREIEQHLTYERDFMGCFAYDDLPKFPNKYPAKLIINTGSVNTSGDHWIALAMNSKECLYFDSFGLPVLNQEIIKWLQGKYESLIYSNICIQHFSSDMCGAFCIAFLENVYCKATYERFVNSFYHSNIFKNDKILKNYLRR